MTPRKILGKAQEVGNSFVAVSSLGLEATLP